MRLADVQRVQRASGLVFLAFLAIHLCNTYAAMLGPEAYDAYQRVMRIWYQHPALEVLGVLAPLVVHVASGVMKIRMSRITAAEMPVRRRLHRYTGIFLAVVVFGHIAATRSASFFAGVYPEFEGMAFTMQWLPAYFYPYYFLFATAAVYHAWYGVQSIFRSPVAVAGSARASYWTPPLIGAALIALSLLAFGGWLFHVDDAMGSDYARFILCFLP